MNTHFSFRDRLAVGLSTAALLTGFALAPAPQSLLGQKMALAAEQVEPAPAESMWIRMEPNEGNPTVDTEAGRMEVSPSGIYTHPVLGWNISFLQEGRASLGAGIVGNVCFFQQTGDIKLSVESSWGQKVTWEDHRQKSYTLLAELNGSGVITYTGEVDGYVATIIVIDGVSCGSDNATATPPATMTATASPTDTPTPGMTWTATVPAPTLTPTSTPTATATRMVASCDRVDGMDGSLSGDGEVVNLKVWTTNAIAGYVFANGVLSTTFGISTIPQVVDLNLKGGMQYEIQAVSAVGEVGSKVCALAPTGDVTATAEPPTPVRATLPAGTPYFLPNISK